MCLTVWRVIDKSWLKLLLQNLAEDHKGVVHRDVETNSPPSSREQLKIFRGETKNGALNSPCNSATGAAPASQGLSGTTALLAHPLFPQLFIYFLPHHPFNVFMFSC